MHTTILLTGSSGWLGRFLAPRLRRDGHEVVGLDVVDGKDTTVVGSVFDRSLIDRIFSDNDITAVVHCGALHKPDIARYSARAFVDVNVTGTLNLLEAASAAGHDRFVFTSTTSLMISSEVRAGIDGGAESAFWLNEDFGPIRPRNIYGVTKYAAEQLCQLFSVNHGLDIAILRTARFFPENDDTLSLPHGANLKANEFLYRRVAVEDAAEAHVIALENIKGKGCKTYVISAPTPFNRDDCRSLVTDAASVIASYFPNVEDLYDKADWCLPRCIDRVYDSSLAQLELGFRPKLDFSGILSALATGSPLPYHHDPDYVSPKELPPATGT
ncbi:NAD-dependent epimerase/dehydratase [Rhodopirellula maiorica SM1]|uniref:NAD-dependent epimerase/dehydratase n=1 Tax=Rhodopirellula maiorica SM1 TaxID=1265738 RepID=M5RTH9_9BACT|nr:NAD(P)-dependent oxidoreductase [Rhodopirellula maiorica]EMI22506.1 NAD-dependent epimerase/dehydratase [Rhodopirellula maiorica SM1]